MIVPAAQHERVRPHGFTLIKLWQNATFARANYVHNVGWNDIWSAPASVDYEDTVKVGPIAKSAPISIVRRAPPRASCSLGLSPPKAN